MTTVLVLLSCGLLGLSLLAFVVLQQRDRIAVRISI
jgi:hypothetical protein